MGYWILHSTGVSKADHSLVLAMGGEGENSIMEFFLCPGVLSMGEWKLEWDLNGAT